MPTKRNKNNFFLFVKRENLFIVIKLLIAVFLCSCLLLDNYFSFFSALLLPFKILFLVIMYLIMC